MGIEKPNHTQTPNLLFDELMRRMGDAELRVTLAIVRQTFGYHRAKYGMSINDIRKMTGLSRQGVINGVSAGMDRGLIAREEDGKGGFLYSMVVNEVDQASQPYGLPLVNDVDQSSQRGRPKVVNEVDQNTPALKKEKENLKEIGDQSISLLAEKWARCVAELTSEHTRFADWLPGSTLAVADDVIEAKPRYTLTVANPRGVEWLESMGKNSIVFKLGSVLGRPVLVEIVAADAITEPSP